MAKFTFRGLLYGVLALVWLLAITSVCAADWRDYVDDESTEPPIEEIVDDPAWEKYAFDLPFADKSGRLSFKDLARSGEPFVIYWWRSDCSSCHLQMPYVERLQNQIDKHGLKFSVVSISIDTKESACLKVVKEKKLSFRVLLDKGGRSTKTKFKKVADGPPQAYLFRAGGNLAATIDGYRSSFSETVLDTFEIELPKDK